MDTTLHHDEIQRVRDDLLVGAADILLFLKELGVLPEGATKNDVYYKKRSSWPIGNMAGESGPLIASKQRIINHVSKLARGSNAA
jgi:hypothetical protein